MQLTGRTDMAAEFVKGKNGIRCESYELYGEKITEIIVSEKDTALFNRPCGRYFTVDSTDVPYVRLVGSEMCIRDRDGIGNVSVIRTDVSANSGIDSVFHAIFCAEKIKADYIVAIDSLACSEPERLCRSIQVTDTGITPGSTAGNRNRLDRAAAGIPVIAVGVPTTMEYESDNDRFFVTRYDIDAEISRYAHIISCALNRSLCPSLSYSDISMLMNYS